MKISKSPISLFLAGIFCGLDLLACSSALPNKWETGELRPDNSEEWQSIDSMVFEIPDSLAAPIVRNLADKSIYEVDSATRVELNLPNHPTRLFLVRGIRIGKSSLCTEVFSNTKKEAIYIRKSTLEPELWFPFMPSDSTYSSPVVVGLPFEPKQVLVHAEKGGDRILRNRKCQNQIFHLEDVGNRTEP